MLDSHLDKSRELQKALKKTFTASGVANETGTFLMLINDAGK